MFRRPHITHIVMARRRLEGGGGCWKRKRGPHVDDVRKILDPLSLSLISQFCSLFVPLSLSSKQVQTSLEFRPKRGSKKCCDTRQKMCSFISFSQRFCLPLRFASRPHSSVDRAIRSRLQHQRSTKIKIPLGCSTVCKIFCGSGYSLIHLVYKKCGEKRDNFTC